MESNNKNVVELYRDYRASITIDYIRLLSWTQIFVSSDQKSLKAIYSVKCKRFID